MKLRRNVLDDAIVSYFDLSGGELFSIIDGLFFFSWLPSGLVKVLVDELVDSVVVINRLGVGVQRQSLGELLDLSLDGEHLAHLDYSGSFYKIFSHKMSIVARIARSKFREPKMFNKR